MRFSISRIRSFKSCRRMYQLRYIEKLKPVQDADALVIGKNYHKYLEELNITGAIAPGENPYSKELAMARAYEKYIYPKFKVVEAEKWIEYPLPSGDTLVGVVDAIAEDGCLVEHKTVGSDITEQYEYNLQWDEQLLAYMMMTDARKMHYTVCRKPTIRQKQNETEEEFFDRMVEWYDTDTETKIRTFDVFRTDEEVEQFWRDLVTMVKEMKNTDIFYKNTCHCNIYGRRCEYSSICLHYDPAQEYVEFVKEEDDYEPTEN